MNQTQQQIQSMIGNISDNYHNDASLELLTI